MIKKYVNEDSHEILVFDSEEKRVICYNPKEGRYFNLLSNKLLRAEVIGDSIVVDSWYPPFDEIPVLGTFFRKGNGIVINGYGYYPVAKKNYHILVPMRYKGYWCPDSKLVLVADDKNITDCFTSEENNGYLPLEKTGECHTYYGNNYIIRFYPDGNVEKRSIPQIRCIFEDISIDKRIEFLSLIAGLSYSEFVECLIKEFGYLTGNVKEEE